MVFGITMICAGIVTILYGYLLAFRHKLSVIKGYNPKRISDPTGYARHLGLAQLVAGILYTMIGSLGLVGVERIYLIIPAFITSVALITSLALTQRKFSVKEYEEQR